MANIGKLTKQEDGSFRGEIATLTLRSKITMRPVEEMTERGPNFRLFAGYGDCGAAFEQTAEGTGQVYLSIKLDDPSFAAPIYVAAFENRDNSDVLDLVWNRPRDRS